MQRAIPVILTLLLVFLVSGCRQEKTPVRIGVNDWPPCEIWYVAKEQGYFKDVPVELVRFSVWSDNIKSLYMGNTDIVHSSVFNSLYNIDKGQKAGIILISDTIEGGDGLAVKKGIPAVSDLKGRTIAVETNTDEHFLLYKTLRQNGVNISDTKLINTSASEGAEKFVSGQADAIYTYEPYLSEAALKGNGTVVSTTRDIPGYMTDTLTASAELIKSRPEDVRVILQAWYRAQEYIKNNPEKAFALMAQKENMTPGEFAGFYNSFHFYSVAENRKLASSVRLKGAMEEIADFLGLSLEKYKGIITTEFLPEE